MITMFLLRPITVTSDNEPSHTERPDSNQTQQSVNTLYKAGSSRKLHNFTLTNTNIMTTISNIIVQQSG